MSSPPYLAHNDHAQPSQSPAKPSRGLTLVLPSLSALKAQKAKKKIKLTYEEPVKKQPRPIKLKPLKEVLTKLITQIKKKDDYAFFLHPVDPAQVPGYSDLISRPMDLGTMTTKVEKGKYRSLEEFASDLKLVTTNAKTFNPPGSIYYTEAERIENYALDHITKAAATVIEYETDWNIDVEHDEPLAVDDDDGTMDKATVPGTPMDVDDSRAGSPSVAAALLAGGKKGKGKKGAGTLSESLEPDGGLPGAKDGLAAFPPGSDEAELMVALKLKGKRYRTKKERLRMEKGGPPLAADGSLDYAEMEDPFTVLSAMVPDPLSRPLLAPLYPTADPTEPSAPPFPAPVNILPAKEIPQPLASTSTSTSSGQKLKNIKPVKRRHWVINRNPPSRRARDVTEEEPVPPWKNPREPVTTDFGTFATLPSVLAEERKRDIVTELGSEDRMFDVLRRTLEIPSRSTSDTNMEMDEESYWKGRAAEAEAYIRDVVYGGVDGYAYLRSVAEFLTPSEPMQRNGEPPTYGALGMPLAHWVEQNVIDPLTGGRHSVLRDAARILNALPPTPPHSPPSASRSASPSQSSAASPSAIRHQIDLSLHTYPTASRALATLQAIHAAKIDLPALIRSPDELFYAEDVWAGRAYREKRKREMDEALARDPEKNAAAYLQWAIAEHREAEAGVASTMASAAAKGAGVLEDAGMLAYALDVAADEIARLAREGVGGPGLKEEEEEEEEEESGEAVKAPDADADGDVVMKTEGERDAAPAAPAPSVPKESGEDPVLKKLRLNLLALAKRAPLDQIMKLPPELVPAHLRHIVPTQDA
ncbi:hypothetical protein L226DRAFT_479067 [Lentinus tigrinus ALCF2SS1-7]|uniref:Bromo domain-containing protein n=1 Tax=Lentinus tigrinus ALCF2SS1-6 TaxID=1328759 RepID=A0A5C2SRD1_9APHY|nr:hypothetical protein L227DRAFT_570310 [Lentinus tigrinus ALCF2SS1-6]RPD80358.1 hypothetical protein L226DRAFT_479067 [Lentinus tigrinus ALCF2SS1-7]